MLLEASLTLSCFILTRTQDRHIGSGSRDTGQGPRQRLQVQLAWGHGSEITQGRLGEGRLTSHPADPKAPRCKPRSYSEHPCTHRCPGHMRPTENRVWLGSVSRKSFVRGAGCRAGVIVFCTGLAGLRRCSLDRWGSPAHAWDRDQSGASSPPLCFSTPCWFCSLLTMPYWTGL